MFKCGFINCAYESQNYREVVFHTLIHTNQDKFWTKCCYPSCQSRFKTWNKYLTHTETFIHDKNIERYNKLQCDVLCCTTVMSNLSELKKHYYSHLGDLTKTWSLDCIFKDCPNKYKCKTYTATKLHFSQYHSHSLIEDLRSELLNNDYTQENFDSDHTYLLP
jgi:hypothetical protein